MKIGVMKPCAMRDHFFAKINGNYTRIDFQEIMYVEGFRNYVKIMTEKKRYVFLFSMKRMEQLLPEGMFVRIHRSFIVSVGKITEFNRATVMVGDTKLPIGHQFKGHLESTVNIISDNCVCEFDTVPIDYLSQKAVAG